MNAFRRPFLNRPGLVHFVGEFFVAGGFLYGMDGLAHLHLKVGAFAWMWMGMAPALAVAAVLEGWRRGALQTVLLAVAIGGVNAAAKLEVTPAQVGYLALLVGLGEGLYRWVLWRRREPGRANEAEPLRLVAAGGIGLLAVLPFVTDHLVGGSDARWYGFMMTDFLQQSRAGVFPIFTGQGEFAFNGGIHPFRSAPLHLWLGGVLDVLTLRTLSVLAVQHLTLIVSSVGAAIVMYLALTALAPARRWLALTVTMIFAVCPGQLAAIYAAEAYMTFMTFPWVVVALHGNALTFRGKQAEGWWWLTIGMALTWLAHPSVGMWVTIVSASLQLGWLAVQGRGRREWLWIGGAALGFGLLMMYYFVGMTEALPSGEERSTMKQLLAGPAGLGLLLGAFWVAERGKLKLATSGAALAIVLFFWFRAALGIYAALAVGLYLATVGLRRVLPRRGRRERALEWILAVLVGAAFLAPLVVGTDFAGKNPTTDDSLSVAREAMRHVLAPVPADAVSLGGFQPGWAMLALFLLSATAGFLGDALTRVFSIATLFLVLLYVPSRGFAEFFWGNLPNELVTVTSIAFDRRMLPVLIPLVAFAGFAALCAIDRARWRQAATLALVALLPWSGWEAAKFLRRGYGIKASWTATKNFYRPESAMLTRFSYDLIKIPAYLSHGVMDYRLESRVLNAGDLSLRLGPEEYAREMEKAGAKEMVLTATTDRPGSPWLMLSPRLDVAPGEDWLMRFHFGANLPPGYLILPSPGGGYREYQLPSSGYAKSFGIGSEHHRVISLRNSGSVPDQYNWEYSRAGSFAPSAGEGEFARVTLSRFELGRLPVRVTSLFPYRASLNLDRAGWLETFRCWLPGYVATVDGRPVEVRESPNNLVMLPVPAGTVDVEVRYAGSRRLWGALGISALAWGVAAAGSVFHLGRNRAVSVV